MATKQTKASRPGISSLGALRVVDPDKWARTVRKAMKAAEGRVPEAAAELGIAPRTLFLWLSDPSLADVERAPVGIQLRRLRKDE